MVDWIFVSRHRLRVEGDVLFIVYDGEMTIEDYRTLHLLLDEAISHHGVRYQLMDLRRIEPLSPDVRREMAKVHSRSPIRAVASFGASASMRVVANLLGRAMELLGFKSRVRFILFKTEEEARAWIDGDRALCAGHDMAATA